MKSDVVMTSDFFLIILRSVAETCPERSRRENAEFAVGGGHEKKLKIVFIYSRLKMERNCTKDNLNLYTR